MSRRIPTYRDGFGFNFWNAVETVGAFIIATAVLLFFYNVIHSYRHRAEQPAPGPDPWDARSLEWSIPSPAPEHNFDDDPVITQFDDWWHRKYSEDETGRVVLVNRPEDIAMVGDASRAHLPSPSYWPFVLALGLPFIAWGLIFNLWITAFGGALVLAGFVGWALEPADDPDLPPHGHDDHGADGDPDGTADALDEPVAKEEVTADV